MAVGQRTLSLQLIAAGHQLEGCRQRIIWEWWWKRASEVLSRWWILWGILRWESHPRTRRRRSGGRGGCQGGFCSGWEGRTGHPTVPCCLWSAATAAVGNSGAKVEWERKGGNSERNHEKCGAWKCLPWFMAAQPGFQEKHIFKFNLRCLFSSSPSTPNCWQGPGFGSKAKMLGNCDHVKKALNNVAFWKCGDSSCLRAQFSAPVNMFGTFAAAEKKKEKKKKSSAPSIQNNTWFTHWDYIYQDSIGSVSKGIFRIDHSAEYLADCSDFSFTCDTKDINSVLALISPLMCLWVFLHASFKHTLLFGEMPQLCLQ